MKYLLASAIALFCLALPGKAQVVPDCGNCTNASWGEAWSPGIGVCVSFPTTGCGNGCNCNMGLMAVITVESGKASAKTDFFGGAFVRDEKGVVTGFRVDRPGPLARNHVKPGDVVFRINSRRPKLSQLGTAKRPIRRAEATWGDDGKLRLRLWR